MKDLVSHAPAVLQLLQKKYSLDDNIIHKCNKGLVSLPKLYFINDLHFWFYIRRCLKDSSMIGSFWQEVHPV